jgi:hypothetical protein
MGPGYPVVTRKPRRERSPVPAVDVDGDGRSCGESFPDDDRMGGRAHVVEADAEAGGVRANPFVRGGRCFRWKCFPVYRKDAAAAAVVADDGRGTNAAEPPRVAMVPTDDVLIVAVVRHGDPLGRVHHPPDDSIRSSEANLPEAFVSGSTWKFDPCFCFSS